VAVRYDLINDMGGLMDSADTARELLARIPVDRKLAENGLFVAEGLRKLSDAEFWYLCDEERRNAPELGCD
jgi:hypothetical protein